MRLLDRLPPEHEHLGAGLGRGHLALELPDQPSLADPGIATEQHHDRALLGSLTRPAFQRGQFPDASDEST